MQIVITNIKGGCGKSTLSASLADVLKADIIDHDNQGTLRVSSHFTNRHIPVRADNITADFVIHDTPPYNAPHLTSLLVEADLILLPVKLQYPDLLALQGLADILRKKKLNKKTVIVFNEVRKPYNKNYHELKTLFKDNYSDLRQASTELSNLVAFSRALAQPIQSKALKQIRALVTELNISKKYLK